MRMSGSPHCDFAPSTCLSKPGAARPEKHVEENDNQNQTQCPAAVITDFGSHIVAPTSDHALIKPICVISQFAETRLLGTL